MAAALAAALKRALRPNRVYPLTASTGNGGVNGGGGGARSVQPPPPRLVARLAQFKAMLAHGAASRDGQAARWADAAAARA